jgi:hypothetical protein
MTHIEAIASVIRSEFYEDQYFHEMELRIMTEKHANDIIKKLTEEGYTIVRVEAKP